MSRLYEAVERKTATIAVIGLGYVGLPLACRFSAAGFDVVGFDTDHDRVEQLHDGESYIGDVASETVERALDNGFEPHSRPNALEKADAFLLAVPTDVEQYEPDMSAVRKATRSVATFAPDREILLVCCSTVYPGATDEVIRTTLRENGRQPGGDTLVSFAPERIDPGGGYDFEEIPMIIGADSDEERDATRALFEDVVEDVVPVESTAAAEMAKVLENTYRMVNIALVNELAVHAEELGIDAWEAIEAAGTKPFGFQPFYPGPGVGGHCIPVDPQFLAWQGRRHVTQLELIERANAINESMPGHVVEHVERVLRERDVALPDASLVVLGVTYKPNVGDVRNSPAVAISELLTEGGADVELVDPHVDSVAVGDETLETTPEITSDAVADADGVLLLVDHDAFAYEPLDEASIVFDAQNALSADVSTSVVQLGNGRSLKRQQPQKQQKRHQSRKSPTASSNTFQN